MKWLVVVVFVLSMPLSVQSQGLTEAYRDAVKVSEEFFKQRRAEEQARQRIWSREGITLWVYNNKKDGQKDNLLDIAFRMEYHLFEPGPNKVLVSVEGVSDIKNLLWRYYNQGIRVRHMIFVAHGDSASAGILDSGNIFLLEGLDRIFLPGAKIYFHSCYSGYGIVGERFMKQVGQTLLKSNGGTVYASWGYYVNGLALKMDGWYPFGKYRRYRVQPGGRGVMSDPVEDNLPGYHQLLMKKLDFMEKRIKVDMDLFQGTLEHFQAKERFEENCRKVKEAREALSRKPFDVSAAELAEYDLYQALTDLDALRQELMGRIREEAIRAADATLKESRWSPIP
ncbi:MAG: hypothetical protein HY399_01495 [Elusimicrobia bacterium]|nr:hypothetical protein [Elusimicrobiota bacterium]